jgi:hypothetical protein
MACRLAEPLFFRHFGGLSLEPSYLTYHNIMGTPKPRVRYRFATLALLIVIIALATALLVQRRRETALMLRVQALEEELAVDRLIFGRLRYGPAKATQ